MSWATAVVLIVLIAAIAGIMRARSNRSDDAARQQHEIEASLREQELEGEVEELRERIHVLERIATDANSSEARKIAAIEQEIETLRDTKDS